MKFFQAVRPKLQIAKTLEQAAIAVDELFNLSFQTTGNNLPQLISGIPLNLLLVLGDDSGDESEEEEERRDEDRNEEEETEDSGDPESPIRERAPSPDEEVVLSASNSQEHVGPSEEEDAEFAKELSKMVTDVSAESRKVDKKTALALWDNATLPPVVRKKRVDDQEQSNGAAGTMAFTLITKRGNKQTVSLRNIFVMVVLTCNCPSSDP